MSQMPYLTGTTYLSPLSLPPVPWKEAYKIMLAVERAYADTEGQEKFDAAFTTIYDLLPAWLKLFVSPNEMKKKLQEWYDLAKDQLDDGKINNSTTVL